MTDLDTAAVRQLHTLDATTFSEPVCSACVVSGWGPATWPCEAIRLLDWGEQMQAERDSARALAVSLEQRVAQLTDALHYIAHFDDSHMQTARTLHWDMRGQARAALATPAEPTQ